MELPKERERERTKKKRGILLEHSSRDALLAISFVPFHIFPFESSFLLGEKAEDKRLFTLWSYSSPRTGEKQKSEKRNKDASHDGIMILFFIFVACFLCVRFASACAQQLKNGSLSSKITR
jgi:hypothetical protein